MEDGEPPLRETGRAWEGTVSDDAMFPMPSDAADLTNLATISEASMRMAEEGPDAGGSSGEYEADAEEENNTTTPPSSGEDQAFSGYRKRIRGRKGPEKRVGLPRDLGAVEAAIRNASGRSSTHIFEPVLTTSFDSSAKAYDFYNLYSWEVGFGIRYGTSYTNRNDYRTSQDIVCQREGANRKALSEFSRCGCKAMVRLHRSDDHG